MSNIREFLDTIITPEKPISESNIKPLVESIPESKITKPTFSVKNKKSTKPNPKVESKFTRLEKKRELNKRYYEKNKITIWSKKALRRKKVVLKEKLKQFLEQMQPKNIVPCSDELLVIKDNETFRFTYTLTIRKMSLRPLINFYLAERYLYGYSPIDPLNEIFLEYFISKIKQTKIRVPLVQIVGEDIDRYNDLNFDIYRLLMEVYKKHFKLNDKTKDYCTFI